MRTGEYNPLLPEVRDNPYPSYEALRETSPVHLVEGMGMYAVSRHEDVLFILHNPALFSSARTRESVPRFILERIGPALTREFNAKTLLTTDPPVHTRMRNLVSRAFTPRRVAEMEPRIRALARALISALPGSGEFDFIESLAAPLPVTVIAEMIGIEPSRQRDFKRWSDASVATSAIAMRGEDLTGVEASTREMRLYLGEMIEARRLAPRDDLISALIQGSEPDGVLSPDDVIAFCRVLLVAGNETTTNLLGNGLLALLKHPEQLERLVREPSLIPNAVEEMLRYDAPVQWLPRHTTRAVQLAGATIPEGVRVLALFGSANRDPRRFPEPDRFDITRDTQGQVAFGQGIHFCLGAPLARLEARVVFEELLTPARRLSFAPTQPAQIDWVDAFFLRGPKSLRVSQTPR